MAHPVGNQHHRTAPVVQGPLVRPPAPIGVAAAPTTLESAHAPEKGYVETAIHWLWEWGAWIFNTLFSCFSKTESPPNVEEVLQPPALPEPEPVFVGEFQEEIHLLNALHRLPEWQQQQIYHHIGLQKAHWWTRMSYEDRGKLEVRNNPWTLRDYLAIN